MTVGYRDKSGNNPTHFLMDRAEVTQMPAVRVGDAIDPNSGDVDFASAARGFYAGTGGNVTIVDGNGDARLLTGVVVGSVVDIQILGTRAASSTITLLNPLY